jgi:hypothetical protein
MSKHPTDNPSPAKGPRREVDDGDPLASPAAGGAVITAIDPKGHLPQLEREWIAEQLIGAACASSCAGKKCRITC